MLGIPAIPKQQQSIPSAPGSAPTLHMWVNTVELDMAAQFVGGVKLSISYSHPAMLSWTMDQAEHALPITYGDFIAFSDDNYGGITTPLFEGWVKEIQPVEANQIRYIAYDATRRAAEELVVLSDSAVFPSAVPRRVYNVKAEADPDKAFAQLDDADVGTILQDLLEAAYAQLVLINAAPPAAIGTAAYVPADFASLTTKPQSKIVFEGAGLRQAIDQILSYYPMYRLLFKPGLSTDRRKWRLYDLTQAPEVTFTLNDASGQYIVLSKDLTRSMENRATAIKFFGPEQFQNATVSTAAGTLSGDWLAFAETVFETNGAFAGTEDVGRKWQIVDPLKRRMAKRLASAAAIPSAGGFGPIGNLAFSETRIPTLLVSWDNLTYDCVPGVTFDYRNGIVTTPQHVYRYLDGAAAPYVLPTDVKLIFAYYDTPLTARYPTSGYAGTAYDVFNVQVEKQIPAPDLVTGFEFGVAVSTTERINQFKSLAQELHKAYCDVMYAGGLTLEGLHYEFASLNKRINLTAIDANGGAVTTGWEAAKSFLTDCEYDFESQLTTLVMSGDHLEYIGADLDALKARLKIEAIEPWYRMGGISASVNVRGASFGYGEGVNADQYGGNDQWSDPAFMRQYGADPVTGRPLRDMPPPQQGDDQ